MSVGIRITSYGAGSPLRVGTQAARFIRHASPCTWHVREMRCDDQIARIVSAQGGVISRRQLLACGLTNGGIGARVRQYRLFRVALGVYALGPHIDLWGTRFAAVLSVGGEPLATGRAVATGTHDPTATVGATRPRVVAVSHWSALHLHGVIDCSPELTHVTIEGTGGRPHRGVRIHRARTLDARDLQVVRNLPVTTPARTILDAALGASERQVRRTIREAEYRQLVPVGAVADVVRRNPFHPASPVVRRADPETAEALRRQTPIEDRMTEIVARLPLTPPRSQMAVAGLSGRTYRVDFAWPDRRLIVETDGRAAHDRTSSFHSDRDRDADLAAAGWLTLRFTALQLADTDRVAATICATAESRPPIS